MYNFNTGNLKLLADYLLKLPDDYGQFDMTAYCDNNDVSVFPVDLIKSENKMHTCGTAGCALGHLPFVKDIVQPKNETNLIYWNMYIDSIIYNNGYMSVESDLLWEFMFSSFWWDIDNTPKGAARRILYAIKDHKACLLFYRTILNYYDSNSIIENPHEIVVKQYEDFLKNMESNEVNAII